MNTANDSLSKPQVSMRDKLKSLGDDFYRENDTGYTSVNEHGYQVVLIDHKILENDKSLLTKFQNRADSLGIGEVFRGVFEKQSKLPDNAWEVGRSRVLGLESATVISYYHEERNEADLYEGIKNNPKFQEYNQAFIKRNGRGLLESPLDDGEHDALFSNTEDGISINWGASDESWEAAFESGAVTEQIQKEFENASWVGERGSMGLFIPHNDAVYSYEVMMDWDND